MTRLTDRAALRAFLDETYLPRGPRMQVMLGSPVSAAVDEEAVRIVTAHDLVPVRRINRIQTRPGESTLRSEDVVDFFDRYGHEYCAAVFPEGAGLDQAGISAAGAAEVIAVAWSSGGLT